MDRGWSTAGEDLEGQIHGKKILYPTVADLYHRVAVAGWWRTGAETNARSTAHSDPETGAHLRDERHATPAPTSFDST